MSELPVEVIRIDRVVPHPDPETTSLEVVVIGGWQSVVKKDSFKDGDLCVYFPLDAVIPLWLSDAMNVTKFLSKGRVKAVRLRGEPSYGLPMPVSFIKNAFEAQFVTEKNLYSFEEGRDLADILGVTKWEPPLKLNAADEETPHQKFLKYNKPENLRRFKDILVEGERVVMTEKIHGMNSRHGLIDGEFMAGTHNVRCKENPNTRVWYVFSDDMKSLLTHLSERDGNVKNDVIMFGEIYGSGIQDLHYGFENGQIGYRCFDISVNGKYLDFGDFQELCWKYKIEMVPLLYQGPFWMENVLSFSNEKSSLPGSNNIMEGLVIRPEIERMDSKVGRVTLKYVFDQYLTRKGGTEFH